MDMDIKFQEENDSYSPRTDPQQQNMHLGIVRLFLFRGKTMSTLMETTNHKTMTRTGRKKRNPKREKKLQPESADSSK